MSQSFHQLAHISALEGMPGVVCGVCCVSSIAVCAKHLLTRGAACVCAALSSLAEVGGDAYFRGGHPSAEVVFVAGFVAEVMLFVGHF